MDYFQPIPANGTGYHRNVFVLFQQKKGKMNYEDIKRVKDDVRYVGVFWTSAQVNF